MASTTEISVAVISVGDSASSIYNEPTPINVLSTSGQVIAGTLSLIGPGTTIGLTPAAATLTIAKIITDGNSGSNISPGDILSLTGNIVAIVGVIGGAGIAFPAFAIGAAIGLLGVAINQEVIPWTGSFGKKTINVISPTIGTNPDPKVKVKVVRYVDPLILDLDGDGLEISPLSKGVLFDANGDTIKTGTAWAASDDGMLVWDRNGNGLIDSGTELFGDETVLANGQKAANGFAALAELDSNADGKFDLNDAQYASLRIWRDMNQDGISQADELQTLADSGVKSISLTNTTVNTNYTDAILAQSGSFTRMDDSTGQAGSFILAQNNFVRAFAPITVSADAKALNNVGGSGCGWVRDLQEAATQSPGRIGLYNQVKNATIRDGSHFTCVQ
jgi:hypothetical protein